MAGFNLDGAAIHSCVQSTLYRHAGEHHHVLGYHVIGHKWCDIGCKGLSDFANIVVVHEDAAGQISGRFQQVVISGSVHADRETSTTSHRDFCRADLNHDPSAAEALWPF